MGIAGVSIDFWDTLVVARIGGQGRQALRRRQLERVVGTCQPARSGTDLDTAVGEAKRRFNAAWLEEQHTPPTDTFVRWIWESLEVTPRHADHLETVRCFQESLLEHPPELTPGLADILEWLSAHVPLAIISDTMVSPGSVLRRYLEQRGVLRYFSAFVFSDEIGCAKPDARAFQSAAKQMGTETREIAHIGDLRRTDIAGALATGAVGILYTGVHEDPEGPDPHFALPSWALLPTILQFGHE